MNEGSRERVSVVAPVFNEIDNIERLHQRLRQVEAGLDVELELIFVDDGSSDGTFAALQRLRREDPRLRILKFARNFGHQTAITAGMNNATGSAAVVIDADLQDPPELIGDMVAKWRQGFDVVYAVREKRKGESAFKLFTASLFYRLIQKITRIDIPLDTGDFRLVSRRVLDNLQGMQEKNRFVRGLVAWVGYRQTGIEYVRDARLAGETKYPLKKMVKFAVDGITSFSFLPLQAATYLGAVSVALAVVALPALLLAAVVGLTVSGWMIATLAVFFLGGIQLLTLGLMGEYIGRIYDEVKDRPNYIIEERLGFDDAASELSRVGSGETPVGP